MKLIYQLVYRMSIALIVILTIWAILFYIAIMDEVNDEIDDSLEAYSEYIIVSSLSGDSLPSNGIGSNNEYSLIEIDSLRADLRPHIEYIDSMVYVKQKSETEPARILRTIFNDAEGKYFELTVSTPTIEKKDLREAILYWIIFLYFSLLVVILIINALVLYKSTKPLYVLLKWIDNYNFEGSLEPLKNEFTITEFQKLNTAVVRSFNRAKELFDNQKQFIGNASHELQTPIAICKNRLELLMEDETLTEFQLGEIIKVSETLSYLSKLNKSLLLLTKIDNQLFTNSRSVDVTSLLARYLSDFEDIYAFMGITVQLDTIAHFVVNSDESLANILVTNLLKNAFIYNKEKGRIVIRSTESYIIFENTGRKEALNKERIFDRFYKQSTVEGSTGLGLAICSSICQSQGFKLDYLFQDSMHKFKISNR
ncbi:MAG: Sensor protein QseC [Bacteroidota bacterium]|jgi:signal transduction histidine kinase